MQASRFLLLATVFMFRCGAPSPPAVEQTPGPIAAEISAGDEFMFNPTQVTVRRGQAVRWTVSGSIAHTVTSGVSSQAADGPGQLFDEPLRSGQTFVFTFNTVGTQPYFCRFHETMGMKGTAK